MLGAAVGSSLIGAASANKAAKSQAAAAAGQLALQGRMYDETVDRFQPSYQSGQNYLKALDYELLGGDRPTFGGTPQEVNEYTSSTTQPNASYNPVNPYWNSQDGNAQPQNISTTSTRYGVGDQMFDDRASADAYAANNPTGGYEYQGFQETPGYQWSRQQGLDAITAGAQGGAGMFSGATQKAQMKFGTGLANQEYNNYLNRLTLRADSGQSAAGNMSNASANYATGGGNALAASGNAQAAGAIGVGNALTGGINNAMGIWNYQNMMNGGNSGGNNGGGQLFGGSSWG